MMSLFQNKIQLPTFNSPAAIPVNKQELTNEERRNARLKGKHTGMWAQFAASRSTSSVNIHPITTTVSVTPRPPILPPTGSYPPVASTSKIAYGADVTPIPQKKSIKLSSMSQQRYIIDAPPIASSSTATKSKLSQPPVSATKASNVNKVTSAKKGKDAAKVQTLSKLDKGKGRAIPSDEQQIQTSDARSDAKSKSKKTPVKLDGTKSVPVIQKRTPALQQGSKKVDTREKIAGSNTVDLPAVSRDEPGGVVVSSSKEVVKPVTSIVEKLLKLVAPIVGGGAVKIQEKVVTTDKKRKVEEEPKVVPQKKSKAAKKIAVPKQNMIITVADVEKEKEVKPLVKKRKSEVGLPESVAKKPRKRPAKTSNQIAPVPKTPISAKSPAPQVKSSAKLVPLAPAQTILMTERLIENKGKLNVLDVVWTSVRDCIAATSSKLKLGGIELESVNRANSLLKSSFLTQSNDLSTKVRMTSELHLAEAELRAAKRSLVVTKVERTQIQSTMVNEVARRGVLDAQLNQQIFFENLAQFSNQVPDDQMIKKLGQIIAQLGEAQDSEDVNDCLTLLRSELTDY